MRNSYVGMGYGEAVSHQGYDHNHHRGLVQHCQHSHFYQSIKNLSAIILNVLARNWDLMRKSYVGMVYIDETSTSPKHAHNGLRGSARRCRHPQYWQDMHISSAINVNALARN